MSRIDFVTNNSHVLSPKFCARLFKQKLSQARNIRTTRTLFSSTALAPTMAKDRESSKPSSHAQPDKEEKKKKKRSEEDGVHKSDKKDKKEKKAKREALAEKALNEIQTTARPKEAAGAAAQSDDDEEGEVLAETSSKQQAPVRPVGALVPFANPLADEKVAKKVFKSVKKGM